MQIHLILTIDDITPTELFKKIQEHIAPNVHEHLGGGIIEISIEQRVDKPH